MKKIMKENLISINTYPVAKVLNILLEDKTTKENIIFATDSYSELGDTFSYRSHITEASLIGEKNIDLQPRVSKALEEQNARTKKRAEVFTPSWLCNKMNNYCDEEWFGKKNVFNYEQDNSWKINGHKIKFPKGKTWQEYVLNKRLEITCGEAPFIASRYDTSTGDIILPPKKRIGMLDRKLRVVNENTDNEKDWMEWTVKAFQSVYGYEFQGDNLLIARINLLMTFDDYLDDRWHRKATLPELKKIANIIVWNFWQMDGLTGTVPFKALQGQFEQTSLFEEPKEEVEQKMTSCKIYDWSSHKIQTFNSLKGEH